MILETFLTDKPPVSCTTMLGVILSTGISIKHIPIGIQIVKNNSSVVRKVLLKPPKFFKVYAISYIKNETLQHIFNRLFQTSTMPKRYEFWVTNDPSHSDNNCVSQALKSLSHYNNTSLYNSHNIQRLHLRLNSTFTIRHAHIVQMDFEVVSETKSNIALDHFPKYVPDHIRLKLFPAG